MGIFESTEDFIEPFADKELFFNDIADIQVRDGMFSCALIRKREGCPSIVVERVVITAPDVLRCAYKTIRAVTGKLIGMH